MALGGAIPKRSTDLEIRVSQKNNEFSELCKKLKEKNIPFDVLHYFSVTGGELGCSISYKGDSLEAELSKNNVSIQKSKNLSDFDIRLLNLITQEYPVKIEKLPWFVKLTIAVPFFVSAALGIYSYFSGKDVTNELALALTTGAFLFTTSIPHAISYHNHKKPQYWHGSEVQNAYEIGGVEDEFC